MPLYTYECPECGHSETKLTYNTEHRASVCEKCGAMMHYVYSAANLRFYGSGFYVNDYKDPKKGDIFNE